MSRFSKWIAVGCMAAGLGNAYAATQLQIDQAWNKGIAWLMLNQHGDGGWSSTLADGNATRQGLGMQATSAAVVGLANMNIKNGYTYLGGVAWLGNAEPASVDALALQTLGLKLSGKDITALGTQLTNARNNNNLWGAYTKYERSVVDTSLGLRAMLDVNAAYVQAGVAVCTLLIAQHTVAPDFGWSHVIPATGTPPSQQSSNIAATVNAVLALKRWQGATTGVTCSNGATQITFTFSTVYANAVSWLVTKKTADNGFGDNGVSGVLESALALRLLKTVAPTNAATATTIDYLIAQQAADGSWRGDALQTAEVLHALSVVSTVATQRPSTTVATDTDKDGVPDGVEAVFGTNPTVADSRFLASGSGATVTQPAQMMAAASVTGAPAAAQLTTVPTTDDQNTLATSWNNDSDVELFVAGSATQLPVLERALEGLYDKGKMQTLLDDGNSRGALQGGLYRAYYGTVSGALIDGLESKRLLIHFSARGGSAAGVAAIARAETVARMAIGKSCVDLDGSGRWSCPAGDTVAAVPDVGLSELPPTWYARDYSTETGTPLTQTELARLDAKPINTAAYGVAASNALRTAGLGDLARAQLTRLLTGAEHDDWGSIQSSLPAQPIVVCRLAPGSQSAAEALILGAGCNANAPAAARAQTNADGVLTAPGYLITESDSPLGVAECLNRAHDGGTLNVNGTAITLRSGGFAIGVLGLGAQPGSMDKWNYVSLDGNVPSQERINNGAYPYVATAWMQWRNTAVKGVAAPTASRLALARYLRERLGDATTLYDAMGFRTLPTGGASSDVCDPLSGAK